MKKLLLIFSFSVFALASLAALTLRQRVAALEKEAARGDAEAMYHLSTLYEHGFDSIPADSMRSFTLLKGAAMAGNPAAQNYLGFKLYPEKKDSALYWLSKAADAGEMKAVSNLAYILLEPDSALDSAARHDRDSRAAELLSKAAEAGVPTAIASLGDLYREGRGVENDTLQAELLYLEAVSAGLRDAEMKLLSMSHSRYTSLTPEKALEEGLRAAHSGAHTIAFNLYKKAAEADIPLAHTLLADAYSSAKGTDYNHDLALRHYAVAALGGDPSAQFILAELLDIFPDALSSVASNDEIPDEIRCQLVTNSDFSNPQYWYSLAAQNGITSAHDAFRRLFGNNE